MKAAAVNLRTGARIPVTLVRRARRRRVQTPAPRRAAPADPSAARVARVLRQAARAAARRRDPGAQLTAFTHATARGLGQVLVAELLARLREGGA
jgi:hypothetical protein